ATAHGRLRSGVHGVLVITRSEESKHRVELQEATTVSRSGMPTRLPLCRGNRPLPLSWVISIVVLILAPPARGEPRSSPTLSVVGTNDLHGRIERVAVLAGYVEILRQVRKEDGGAVLLVDAGDMFQGTVESNTVEGASVVRAYNAVGY